MSDPRELFPRDPDATNVPPFETDDLRTQLARFLDSPFADPSGGSMKVGDYQWGVYAFFDYDGEPIYVGQTRERVRVRIRRHLTNQRTDAVAMSVLDPFEVLDIEVWPLPELEGVNKKDAAAKAKLNALERLITEEAVERSRFKAILNEKDPPVGAVTVTAPPSFRARVVSDRVFELRRHPDFRLARRALIISRLAQVISEREVQGGLRRVLLTQAKRMQWLSERRYQALGGAASVATEGDEDAES
ncbi:GIY-YIG nuclease family protein [Phenylobacterium sp.]|nr:GIY-YIG nuclease family protein [Phenylobacterium sp.]MBP6878277.1 GIY-YIG nuclease family protein [Phenylobacterium sp.]